MNYDLGAGSMNYDLTPEQWYGIASLVIGAISFVVGVVISVYEGKITKEMSIDAVIECLLYTFVMSGLLIMFWPLLALVGTAYGLTWCFAYTVRALIGGPWLEKKQPKEEYEVL